MKSIVVPTDFSEQAEHALKVAANLAKAHESEIILMHMLELDEAFISYTEMRPEQMISLMNTAERKLAKLMSQPFLKGINLVPIVKHYKVFSEVNEIATKYNCDLVVMGSHGADGLKEIFVGSNAEKVVRHSDTPVLVVKSYIEDFKAREFVFASDFQETNLIAFKKAVAFAKTLSANLNLVYINTPDNNFLSTTDTYEKINTFLNKAKMDFEVQIYNDYTVEQGVLNYSEQIGADLIGIPTHGRKGLSYFFRGSIGEDVVNHSKIPVVTFKIG